MSWTEGDGVLRGAREVGPPATHSSWHRSSLGWRARQAGSANPNVHLHPRHKANDVWFGADPAVEAHCQAKALTCDEPWRLIAVGFHLVGVRAVTFRRLEPRRCQCCGMSLEASVLRRLLAEAGRCH